MSKRNPTSFSVYVPTKPFLKKYLQAQYGEPIVFSTDNYFGIVLTALLEKQTDITQRSAAEIRQRFDKLDASIEVQLPMRWLRKYVFGQGLTEAGAITLTKLFEEKFEEELYMFCQLFQMCGTETKDALLRFCEHYNIEIDVDITYDSLKKKEYRYRKKLEKSLENFPRNCPPKNPSILSPQSLTVLKENLSALLQKENSHSLSFQRK